jgi:hypothetical protein
MSSQNLAEHYLHWEEGCIKQLKYKQKPKMKRVIINSQYTYETDLDISIGDSVLLPTASWLVDALGDTWEGEVTSLESDYDGWCARIIEIA